MKRSACIDLNGRNGAFVRSLYLAVGAAALLLQTAPTMAGAEYDAWVNYFKDGDYVSVDSYDEADTRVSYQSFSGGVGSGWSVGPGESFGMVSGYADASTLSLGVSAQMVSTPANSHLSDAGMNAGISNRLTVSPGTSGLAVGDVTTLSVKIRLDGSLHGEATSWPEKGGSHAELDAGLTVHDYAIQIDTGEGWWSPAQASFGASTELDAYDVYKPYWGYSYYSYWSESWHTESNMGSNDSSDNWGEKEEQGESFHYEDGHYFDTGELILEFEAIVGHTLDFDASLYLYLDAYNDAETWAHFDNTLSFDVASPVDGLGLEWETVPEPASLSLLAAGALALLRRRTRVC